MRKALYILIILNLLRLISLPFIENIATSLYFNGECEESLSFYTFIFNTLTQNHSTNFIWVHIFFFFISLLTQWAVFILIKKIIRPKRKYLAWIVVSSTLFITLFSLIPMADNLLALFWILSIITLYNAIFYNDLKSWIVSGIFIGLASTIKLTGFALPVGLLLFLIFSSRYRYHLYKLGPYITILLTLLITIPIWKGWISHESITKTNQLAASILNHIKPNLNSFTSFISFQFVLIFPPLYIGLWWASVKYLARIFEKPNQVNPEFWFLLAIFLPLFIGFHLIALFDWVDYFGLIPVYLTGFIVLLKLMKHRWFIWSIVFSIAVHAILILSILFNFIN